jgi:hypothetical protein
MKLILVFAAIVVVWVLLHWLIYGLDPTRGSR